MYVRVEGVTVSQVLSQLRHEHLSHGHVLFFHPFVKHSQSSWEGGQSTVLSPKTLGVLIMTNLQPFEFMPSDEFA